jgi:hypothetical protein
MQKIIHNTETNEIIEVELSVSEINQIEKMKQLDIDKQAEANAKKNAKDALLARLGITADEAKLLLG